MKQVPRAHPVAILNFVFKLRARTKLSSSQYQARMMNPRGPQSLVLVRVEATLMVHIQFQI
eukprot:scaffold50078_cov51-Attheya_sp.AAC.1